MKVKDGWGNVTGYRTVKHKVGYKKAKRKYRRVPIGDFLGNIIGYKRVKVKSNRKRKRKSRRKKTRRRKERGIWDIGF